jgi:hypothetical protein
MKRRTAVCAPVVLNERGASQTVTTRHDGDKRSTHFGTRVDEAVGWRQRRLGYRLAFCESALDEVGPWRLGRCVDGAGIKLILALKSMRQHWKAH